jgi:methyltransferase family protein
LDYETFLSSISFKFLQPDAVRGTDNRYLVERGDRPPARLLELPYAPVDLANTMLPSREPVRRGLRELCELPRMSTVAIAAMINEAVARMPPSHAFVNVGVWRGFTFLSGMTCNEDKICVGIDDFSLFSGPEASFRREFDARKSENHSFHTMDYRDYFAKIHDQPIGLYCYDGDHSYESQWRALEIAEPYFAEECLVLVDDSNWLHVRRATLGFAAASPRAYRVLMDVGTTDPEHPTLWNGILLLRVGGESGSQSEPLPSDRRGTAASTAPSDPARSAPKGHRTVAGEPLVSLIVHVDESDPDETATTIETALAQTWPAVEVLVADDRREGSGSEGVLSPFEGQIEVIRAERGGRTPSLEAALGASRAEFVSVVGAGTKLRKRAVHMGLGFPVFRRAVIHGGEDWYEQLDGALAAAEEILEVIPSGAGLILVDEGAAKPRTLGPLHEYPIEGGHPGDDDHAIRDLETLRERGAAFLAFQRPAYWWLEHYKGLADHLGASYSRVLENDRVILFDLR